MCKWYCTSNGLSTNLACLQCGCRYCAACLHGEAGKMKSLIKCARCNKNPKSKPNGERSGWAGQSEDRGMDPSGLSLRPDVDKPNGGRRSRSPAPSVGPDGKPLSIFEKLTDPKQYTGAHKHRFDADGKGRGLDGRDSVATGKGTHAVGDSLRSKPKPGEVVKSKPPGAVVSAAPAAAAAAEEPAAEEPAAADTADAGAEEAVVVSSVTGGGGAKKAGAPAQAPEPAAADDGADGADGGADGDAKSAPAAAAAPAAASPAKKKFVGVRMECPTCGFKWNRPPGEDHKPCPKCLKPLPKNYVPPKQVAARPKVAAPAAAAVAKSPQPKAAAPAAEDGGDDADPNPPSDPAGTAPSLAAPAPASPPRSKSPTSFPPVAGAKKSLTSMTGDAALDRGVGFSKPAAAQGSQATVGYRMECPTCGFKWNRPAGEDNKPCPKCLKTLPKSAVKGVAKVAANTKKGPSIFDKLTDPKQYTGAHKARFDRDGKGRGKDGRTD